MSKNQRKPAWLDETALGVNSMRQKKIVGVSRSAGIPNGPYLF